MFKFLLKFKAKSSQYFEISFSFLIYGKIFWKSFLSFISSSNYPFILSKKKTYKFQWYKHFHMKEKLVGFLTWLSYFLDIIWKEKFFKQSPQDWRLIFNFLTISLKKNQESFEIRSNFIKMHAFNFLKCSYTVWITELEELSNLS